MPGHLLHGEEKPELPYFIYFGFSPSLTAVMPSTSPNTLTEYTGSITWGWQPRQTRPMGTVFWHNIPLIHLLAPLWMARELV